MIFMRDFLGREFKVGDFCVGAGGGNRTAEYGMLLLRVEQVDPTLRMRRLTETYDDRKWVVGSRLGTMTNGNKYLILSELSDELVTLFNKTASGQLSAKGRSLVANWLHGNDEFAFPSQLDLGPLLTDAA